MVDRAAVEHQTAPDQTEEPDDILVARVTAGRHSGSSCDDDVDELIRRAAERNKAALERLAQ